MQSIEKKVINRIYGNGRGWAFSKKDFLDIADDGAIRLSLMRLTERGTIRRIMRGIYDYPRFKGGTSLSKVFGLIDRFSEDIDLILDWRLVTDQNPMGKRSNTQQARLNAEISEKARAYIADALLTELGEALEEHCTTEVGKDEEDQGHVVNIHYPETAERGYLRPCIRLEIGPLAAWLPHSDYVVRPYAAEEFPNQFEDMECPVRAIEATRTFWEKATILHQEGASTRRLRCTSPLFTALLRPVPHESGGCKTSGPR